VPRCLSAVSNLVLKIAHAGYAIALEQGGWVLTAGGLPVTFEFGFMRETMTTSQMVLLRAFYACSS